MEDVASSICQSIDLLLQKTTQGENQMCVHGVEGSSEALNEVVWLLMSPRIRYSCAATIWNGLSSGCGQIHNSLEATEGH